MIRDMLLRLGTILFMTLWAGLLAWLVGTTYELALLYTLLGFVANITAEQWAY